MINQSTIKEVRTWLFRLPLDQPLQDANHGLQTHFEIVTATIVQPDQSEETGYLCIIGKGGYAIQALIDHDTAPSYVSARQAKPMKASDIAFRSPEKGQGVATFLAKGPPTLLQMAAWR